MSMAMDLAPWATYDPDNPLYGMPFCDIVETVRQRQEAQGIGVRDLIEIRDWYNGDEIIPMVTSKGEPIVRSMAPAIVANAVDHNSRRAASVKPYITVPAMGTGPMHAGRADTTRRAIGATWHKSNFKLIRRRYYRHLNAYATTSLVVVPDMDDFFPRVQLRDPLASLPDVKSPDDVRPPTNIGYIYQWSGSYLRHRWPKLCEEYGGPIGAKDTWQRWSTVEWYDAECIVYGLVGPLETEGDHITPAYQAQPWMEISRFPNRAGIVPAVCLEMPTLDKIMSHVRNIIAKSELLGKLTMLDIETQERSIAPDVYVIARQGMVPQLVGNQWYDGRTGKVNMLSGVEKVDTLRMTPDVRTSQVEDRLERSASVDVGLNPAFNAESYGNQRSGRQLDASMAIATDPRIMELHEISEAHLVTLNEVIIKTYKGYWPGKTFSMFSGWLGDREFISFKPSRDFETCENLVEYPIPGLDIQGTTVVLAQLASTKIISLEETRRLHPYVNNALLMSKQIDQEDMNEAYKRGLSVMMASGQAPPELGIYINERLEKGDTIFEAAQWAFEKMADLEQADVSQGNPASPMTPPGMPPGPGGMPLGPGAGAAPPGVETVGAGVAPGVEPPPATMGPSPDQAGLKRLMLAMSAGGGRR